MSIERDTGIFAPARVAEADANAMLGGSAATQMAAGTAAMVEARMPTPAITPGSLPRAAVLRMPTSSAAQRGKSRITADGRFFRRGPERIRVNGVTYGPFAPNAVGEALPDPARVESDLRQMRAAGINALRIYSPPPLWLLDTVELHGAAVLVDVPCPKHLGFLEDDHAVREARQRICSVVSGLSGRGCVLGCGIGNEITADLVRWYGARRIERFLGELADAAHQTDPDLLVTYGNFPPTEYLDLPFLDFQTFNVYLHDRATFRRYLLRLSNRCPDRPLVLGELGMDTLRHGEEEQAQFLAGHLREVTMAGLAGAFVFSWTDDWFTKGWQIEDWAFGLTRRDRSPKRSYHAVSEVFDRSPAELLARQPRVSVIVCSYNGGPMLEECLRSLRRLDYPDYEVILVDDGSTDETPAISVDHPWVRTIRQENRGLSVARNVGLEAASGEVVAYTDSDCLADADWLTLLVQQLEANGAAAVGGPNLTPEDGRLAECVACAPGQPTHVLENDEAAEHIPGCNMAFRRDALLSIGGFDPVFRKAGDDVDVCWRLREAGYRITFSPGALVWHHRRQTPRAYLRQQAGYGEAEAMLARKHPDRFNAWGAGKWRGVLYGDSLSGIRLGRARVHGGVFGQGLFQTLYQPRAAHWMVLPSTLEWQLAAAAALGVGLVSGASAFWLIAIGMLGLTIVVTVLQAAQAKPARRHDGLRARATIALLCWLQPLVRSGRRYWARYGSLVVPHDPPCQEDSCCGRSLRVVRYISIEGVNRAVLLTRAAEELRRGNWHPVLDSGWSPWDIEVPCAPGVNLQVRSVQEFYGGNSAQVALWFRLRGTGVLHALMALGILAAALGAAEIRRHSPLGTAAAAALLAAGLACAIGCWYFSRRGRALALRAAAIFDRTARALGMTPFEPTPQTPEPPR